MTSPPELARWNAIDRPIGWLVALGGCILILDQGVVQYARLPDFVLWWNAGALLVMAGVVGLAVFGLLLPKPVLTVMWLTLPFGYLALQAAWPVGYRGDDLAGAMPWLWLIEPAMVTLLLLTFRPAVAVATGLAFTLTPAVASLLLLGHLPATIAVQTPNQLGNVVYLAIFVGVRHQLDRLHAGEREAERQRQRQVRAATRLEQHAALERLVHDEVLASLSATMLTDGRPSEVLRRDARNAIGVLSLSTDPEPTTDGPLSSKDALAVLTSTLRRTDKDCALEAEFTPASYPGAVVRGVALAGAEALRNSIRHAGAAASRQIRITLTDDRIRVSVHDDGVGFVPDPHSPRLGVRRSIVARMEDLGGSARIESAPGEGTAVILTWPT